MRCSKAREFLSRHLDDQLPPAQTGDLTRHLDGCDECRDYREDLRIGQRLLAATEPELPENFDWKLQLRLNQTLREAAGEAVMPWEEPSTPDRWAFLRNFGGAAAAGLAAVLALALFMGPEGPAISPAGGGAAVATAPTRGWDASDRLPLSARSQGRSLFAQGGAGMQTVSGQQGVSGAWSRPTLGEGWTTRSRHDAQMIQRLRIENSQLRTVVSSYQRQFMARQSHLDTTEADALDLQEDR